MSYYIILCYIILYIISYHVILYIILYYVMRLSKYHFYQVFHMKRTKQNTFNNCSINNQ